jgi:hypothetical protein
MDPGYADLSSAGLFLEECLLGQETDSRQMHGVFPSRRLIAAACTLVAVQVLVLTVQNATRPLTSASEFIQFALGLVAILACRNAFQRSRGIGKYPWRFLTISFGI